MFDDEVHFCPECGENLSPFVVQPVEYPRGDSYYAGRFAGSWGYQMAMERAQAATALVQPVEVAQGTSRVPKFCKYCGKRVSK